MKVIFRNRIDAGQRLAIKLTSYANQSDCLVLALPRGGVPVAVEIAQTLHLPLDICLVRKLGVPHHKELAMGAIGPKGIRVINHNVVDWLKITSDIIEEVTLVEAEELKRRDRVYRGDKPLPEIYQKTIILVDDGVATGSTIKAAIATLKEEKPHAIIIAVPVAPPTVYEELAIEVDQIVCLEMPEKLHSISLWYENFSQTTDQEVCDLLSKTMVLPDKLC
ncbi:phosphoribosyltransferase [Aphanothece sacrum]|nr:phosphoribosyltransferase [Aphanothece sacrum]